MEKPHLIVIADHYLTFIKDQIEILSENFENIHVFIHYNPIAELSNYFPLENLKQFRKKNLIDTSGIPDNVHLHIIPHLYLPIRFQSPFSGDRYFIKVDKIIQKLNLPVDIIHAHFVWPNGYVGVKLKEKYNVPFVITAHGYDIYDLPFRNKKWRDRIKQILNSSDYLITVSAKNQQCIRELDVLIPVSLIPNGFRRDFFYPISSLQCRQKLGLPLDKKILVSVGNLVREKGYVDLVNAVAKIVKETTDIHCYIIGGGSLYPVLNRQIKESNLEYYFTLVGGRSHSEIPLWINACDVFVLPSLMEGNPTVMFECLGCGKPFIGTNVGGIPEIIISDEYGLLVEPGDSSNMADCINSALKKSWNIDKIVRYSDKYSWTHICQEIYEIYQKFV